MYNFEVMFSVQYQQRKVIVQYHIFVAFQFKLRNLITTPLMFNVLGCQSRLSFTSTLLASNRVSLTDCLV